MSAPLAYVCGVRLFRSGSDDDQAELLASPFAESVRQRAVSIEKRKAWKSRSAGASMGLEHALWGSGAADIAQVTGLSRGRTPGELLYCLNTSSVSGVFARGSDEVEQRLFHTADHWLRDITASDAGPLACAVNGDGGTANLALLARDGSELFFVTDGDSVDLAPQFLPDSPTTLVYQSSGVGRNEAGVALALGPAAICQLDAEQGNIETLLEDEDYDFVSPRLGRDGSLYCIRRPYHGAQKPLSVGRVVLDFLLFPFRVLFALFQWLSYFTLRYTGKPLATTGGEEAQTRDAKQLMLYGNLVQAEIAARANHAAGDDTPATVPQSWQLVRRARGGELEVLAKGVVAFDLSADGQVVYSNGRGVYALSADGKKAKRFAAEGIERLATLE